MLKYNTLKEYDDLVERTCLTPDRPDIIALGLASEIGEVLQYIYKFARDNKEVDVAELIKELGDVLWGMAALAQVYGITLEQVMQTNMTKLEDRLARNVLRGSGDNR